MDGCEHLDAPPPDGVDHFGLDHVGQLVNDQNVRVVVAHTFLQHLLLLVDLGDHHAPRCAHRRVGDVVRACDFVGGVDDDDLVFAGLESGLFAGEGGFAFAGRSDD